jgi:predicted RNase H-like nuclease (RuvC/YqgF family)
MGSGLASRQTCTKEKPMDSPTSAAPDEKTPPLELASATQLSKENTKPSGPLEISAERFNSSVARLTSNSIDGLQGLVSELQKMQEFLNSEVDKVQRQNRQRLGRNQYYRRNDWPVEKHRSFTNTSVRRSQCPRGGTGGQL